MFNWLKKIKPEDAPVVTQITPPISLEDIKDDDMMVAALVATIDYASDVKTDIRLTSIKQIG
ncbi:MAG: hypothetical protein WCQ80_00280 [Bacilli bacterium]